MSSFLLMVINPPVKESAEVIITSESDLSILGKTNVHSFSCDYNIDNLNKPVKVTYQVNDNMLVFDQAILQLNNTGFDCGGKGINNDFNKLLRTEEYPFVLLEVENIKPSPHIPTQYIAIVTITIAGKNNTYQIPLKVVKTEMMNVQGTLNLKLRDFDLKAPSRVMGLITVKEQIQINFDLSLMMK